MDDRLRLLLRGAPLPGANTEYALAANAAMGMVGGKALPSAELGVLEISSLFFSLITGPPHPLFPDRERAYLDWLSSLEPFYRDRVSVDTVISTRDCFQTRRKDLAMRVALDALTREQGIPAALIPAVVTGTVEAHDAWLSEGEVAVIVGAVLTPGWSAAYRSVLAEMDT